jgi:hypothetical protein
MRYSRVNERQSHHHFEGGPVPKKGDRIESIDPETAVKRLGTVQHVDDVQILVKWDDGRSENLEPDIDRFRIVEVA